MALKCSQCGKLGGFMESGKYVEIKNKEHCPDCAKKYLFNATNSITATTTSSVDGFFIEKYIDIGSSEVVLGTGPISEFTGGLSDFFGKRSSHFEDKLKKAKNASLMKLKLDAYEAGANAIVGIDLDYTEFTGNRIGVIVNGTFVRVRPDRDQGGLGGESSN